MCPLLSVYTPTYQRPIYLQLCKNSVARQIEPVQHVVVEDKVGLGVGGMFRDIQNHADQVIGKYVLMLSDDNVLIDALVVRDLSRFVAANQIPDVVIWQGHLPWSEHWFPFPWEQEPVVNQIDASCFVVRRDIWLKNKSTWQNAYEADFHFIHKLWHDGCRFAWMKRHAYLALDVLQGQPERFAE